MQPGDVDHAATSSLGSLFTTSPLVVLQGPDWMGRRLAKPFVGRELSRRFPVKDSAGTDLAYVEAVRAPAGGGHVALRIARALLSNYAGTRVYRVADAGGAPLFELRVSAHDVSVKDPAGAALGELRNVSRTNSGTLEVRFDRSLPEKSWGVQLWGDPLATLTTDHWTDRFDGEVKDPQGRAIARVTNEGGAGSYRVEVVDSVDEELRTLIVAFACALVDRAFYMHNWLWVPSNSSRH